MAIWMWCVFLVFVCAMLALDLGVFNRKTHVFTTKEALGWTAFWVALALLFIPFAYWLYEAEWLVDTHERSGKQAALEFFTGYVIEKSLSLDNIFVIALIFVYFRVPAEVQHRVLFWGIFGALVMRGVMIVAGAALIERFEWMIYVFGGILLLTAIRMFRSGDEEIEPENNWLVKLARRLYPVSSQYEGSKFFTHLDGKLAITPLFLVLLVVESSDVLFAVDSIPAIFAVSRDPFIVYTSNVFAILGLRSLYFALASIMDKFHYLKLSLVCVLAFVGIKMMLTHWLHIPPLVSLGVICAMLTAGVVASQIYAKEHPDEGRLPDFEPTSTDSASAPLDSTSTQTGAEQPEA